MSKKSIVERENKRIYFRKKYILLRSYLRGKIIHSISFQEKLFYQSQLDKLPRDSSFSKMVWFMF